MVKQMSFSDDSDEEVDLSEALSVLDNVLGSPESALPYIGI